MNALRWRCHWMQMVGGGALSESQWESRLPWQKNPHINLEINKKWSKELILQPAITFSLMGAFSVNPAGLLPQQPFRLQTKHFATDFQFTGCVPVNRSLPLEVQFTDESVACSRILSSALAAVRSALTAPGLVAGLHYSVHSPQPTTQKPAHAKDK